MSNNGETPKNSSLDSGLDKALPPTKTIPEQYQDISEHGLPLAAKPVPISDTEPTKLTSWTMGEIERQLSNDALMPPKAKIEQFAVQLSRKTDFRMRALSKQMGLQLKRESLKEMTSGPIENRVREFDIKSQTFQMISSNAVMGMYQFQKNQVLPYMRKSLALDYQKVNILKDIGAGIASMHVGIVSKLEAIKLNTAAGVPRKQGYFKKVMTEVGVLNRHRVATNISNFLMDRNDKMYQKYIAPRVKRMNDVLQDTTAKGGVDGLRRNATVKLYRLRQATNRVAQDNVQAASTFGKLKITGAKATSKLLGVTIAASKRLKLKDPANQKVSNLLRGTADDLSQFSPFQQNGQTMADTILSRMLTAFSQWRKEYRTSQDKTINLLSSINDKICNRWKCKQDDGKVNRSTKSTGPSTSQPITSTPKSLIDKAAVAPVQGFTQPTTSISDQNESKPLKAPRDMAPRMERPEIERQGFITRMGGKISSILSPRPIEALAGPVLPVVAQDATSHVATWKLHRSTQGLIQQGNLDRTFVAKLFDRLGSKVTSVAKTVETGNVQRSKFEKIQQKWKDLSDKLLNRKPRANSYEDLLEQRKNNLNRKGLIGRTMDKLRNFGNSAGERFANGDLLGGAASLIGDAASWATDKVTDKVGGFLGKKGSRLWRKAKLLRTARGRRLMSAVSKRGATNVAEEIVKSGASKGLLRKSGSLLWRGSKGAVKLGGRLALGGTKGILKGGGKMILGGGKALLGMAPNILSLAKSGVGLAAKGGGGLLGGALNLAKANVPAMVIGAGADYAEGWFNKNTKGTTRRLGTTAASMAKYAAMGSMFGPGGALVGAALGAVVANSDLLVAGLKKVGSVALTGLSATATVGKTLWHNVFGQDPVYDKWGRVKRKETQSIFGNMNSMIYGRDAKYSKSGDVVMEGRTGIVPGIRKGFDLFFFGVKDSKDKNSFKPGSSIVSRMGAGMSTFFEDFKKTMSAIPGELMASLKGLGAGATNLINSAGTAINNGIDYVGKGIESAGAVVSGSLHDMVKRAAAMVGLNENTDNGKIRDYLNKGGKITQNLNPAKTPWCAAFVNSTLGQAGIKGSGSLAASSFKNWGTAVNPNEVREGDVLLEDRGAAVGASGDHVGIATGATRVNRGRLQIEMLSGNSRNSITRVFYDADKLKIRRGEPGASGSAQPQSPTGGSNTSWGTNSLTGSGGKGTGSLLMKPSPGAVGTTSIPKGMEGAFNTPNAYTPQGGPIQGSQDPGTSSNQLFNNTVNYLSGKKGWSKIGATGIAVTLYGESNLNPRALNRKGGGMGAQGVAQWRGSRIAEVERKIGKPLGSMNLYEQLDAVDWELRSGRNITKNASIRNGTTPLSDAINSSPNMESVVQQMVYRYERPGNMAGEVARRIQIGRSLLHGMGTNPPAGGSGTGQSGNTPGTQPVSARPAVKSAPKPNIAPVAPHKEAPAPSWTSTLTDTMGEIKDYFTGSSPKDKPSATQHNTVIAPVINGAGRKSSPAATTTMTMAKTSVRTGN